MTIIELIEKLECLDPRAQRTYRKLKEYAEAELEKL